MSTRNLLMALAVAMVFTVIADRVRGAHAVASEQVLQLPPIQAAFEAGAVPTATPQLWAIQGSLHAQRRDTLDRHLARAQRVALADAVVSSTD